MQFVTLLISWALSYLSSKLVLLLICYSNAHYKTQIQTQRCKPGGLNKLSLKTFQLKQSKQTVFMVAFNSLVPDLLKLGSRTRDTTNKFNVMPRTNDIQCLCVCSIDRYGILFSGFQLSWGKFLPLYTIIGRRWYSNEQEHGDCTCSFHAVEFTFVPIHINSTKTEIISWEVYI